MRRQKLSLNIEASHMLSSVSKWTDTCLKQIILDSADIFIYYFNIIWIFNIFYKSVHSHTWTTTDVCKVKTLKSTLRAHFTQF